jgi:hypothetical protein
VALRLTAVALACAAPAARAEVPTIDIGPGAGIDVVLLHDALRGRIETAGTLPLVHIDAIPGGVAIAVAGRRREVPLDGATGREAARLVALAMVDLLGEPAAADGADGDRSNDVVARPAPSVEVGVHGGASRWSGLLATAGVDVVVHADGHLIGIEAAAGSLVTGALHLDAGFVRASAVARRGVFEARGSLVAAPLRVGDGDGDTTLLFGVGASVSARLPLTSMACVVVSGGADLFATRTEYAVGGMPVAATPWLAPWMTLGFEVAP